MCTDVGFVYVLEFVAMVVVDRLFFIWRVVWGFFGFFVYRESVRFSGLFRFCIFFSIV